jgi:DNA replication and repair protein RecF
LRVELDRILRQRNTLLKQAGGRLSAEVGLTLDVWDAKLVEAGTALAAGRTDLVERLGPVVAGYYRSVAGAEAEVTLGYVASWQSPAGAGLDRALAEARPADVRRGVSTVGPHRDELAISLRALPSRTHASQGEQRSLALALRLGGHAVVTAQVGSAPVLLLDDVFSELDPGRSAALIGNLPKGQALLTTAGPLPPNVDAEAFVNIKAGAIIPSPDGDVRTA